MDSKTQDFLQKLKDSGHWNDEYDYSKGVYVNTNTKFEVWCNIHKAEITKKPTNLLRGEGCKFCSYEKKKKSSNKKKTIEDMHKLAKAKGGKCLSEIYTNAHTSLLWECKNGHQWEAKPNKIQQGTWCKKCGNKKTADSQRGNIQLAIDLAIKKKGRCLSTEYITAREPLEWECDKGHRWFASYYSIKGHEGTEGSWCKECNVGSTRTIKYAKEFAIDLKGRPDWIIADMGCGENLLSKEIENKVYAFDYVALEGEDVVECDIKKCSTR